MKRVTLLLGAAALSMGVVKAQDIGFTTVETTSNSEWHRSDYSSGAGASIDSAVALLDPSEGSEVVVAVIGQGVNTQHPDIAPYLYTNPKEIAGDGIDNDKNGYIDDVNGWNFVGLGDRSSCKESLSEADRIFLRDRVKYFEGDEAIQNSEEGQYFINKITFASQLGVLYKTHEAMKLVERYTGKCLDTLRQRLPEKSDYTQQDFTKNITIPKMDSDSLNAFAFTYVQLAFDTRQQFTNEPMLLNEFYTVDMPRLKQQTFNEFEENLANYESDRALVGDNEKSLEDRYYGNNNIYNSESNFAAAVSDVIVKTATVGGESKVKIMPVRVLGNEQGEPTDKDLANGIRYAVDNGAHIINVFFPKEYSSNPEWIAQAVDYATEKGAIIISAAGDRFKKMENRYPTATLSDGKSQAAVINVGACDIEGFPAQYSNYGDQTVDIFAPGDEVYAAAMGDTYATYSSSIIASAITTGVAALIKSYSPELSGEQIHSAIIDGAESCDGVDVICPYQANLMEERQIVNFGNLSSSKGVLNAENAILKNL